MFPDFNDPAYSEQGHYTDFPEYGKQCGLIEQWRHRLRKVLSFS